MKTWLWAILEEAYESLVWAGEMSRGENEGAELMRLGRKELERKLGVLPGKLSGRRALKEANGKPVALARRVERAEEFGVAVVPIEGVISAHYPWWGTDPRQIIEVCRDLEMDGGIDKVVLDVNSPGGHVTLVHEAAEAVARLAEKKLVVSYTDRIQGSAAEWIATGAAWKYAAPSAMVGSVGVFTAVYDFSKLFEEAGVKALVFRDGKYKALGLMGKEVTKEEAAHLQAGVDETSRIFKGWMRERRKGLADEVMQGQTFTGLEGAENGLLDGVVDSLEEVILAAVAAR